MTQETYEAKPDDIDLDLDLEIDVAEIEQEDIVEESLALEKALALDYGELSTDLLQIFLRDVGKYRLLTAQEEIDLSTRKEAGDKEAAELLVLHNLRAVVQVAGKYHHKKKHQGIGYLDLIQEGMFGLLTAVEKYDHTRINPASGRPYKFSTYAFWWIRQAVARGLAEKSRTIRVPMHIVDKLNKISAAETKFRNEFERDATVDELAGLTGLKPGAVAEIIRGSQTPLSLSHDVTFEAGDSGSVGSNELDGRIEDETVPSPHELVSDRIDHEILINTLESLSPRNLDILEHRFGLNGKEELTLTEIGKMWGITYQRVRQIELKLMDDLRENPDIQILRSSNE